MALTEEPKISDPRLLIDYLKSAGPAETINWEGLLARQYRRLLDSPRVIVDVGAHAGAHTSHFLNIGARKVVCFEPLPHLAEALKAKFADQPVEVHAVALNHEEGESEFVFNMTTPSESGLKQRVFSLAEEQRLQRITVQMRRLDSFALQDVDFIKTDCEGAELNVLSGGRDVVRRDRPFVSVEYGADGYAAYGLQQDALLIWAVENGYRVSDLFGNSLNDRGDYEYCVDKYYWDFLLIPEEKWQESSRRLHDGAREIIGNIRNLP